MIVDLPENVRETVVNRAGPLRAVRPLGGGCIANASRVDSGSVRLFLKWAHGEAGATFEAEAAGLRALLAAGSPLSIPEVLAVKNAEDAAAGFLLLEWLEPAPADSGQMQRLGEGLAALHGTTEAHGRFGFETDNFIGQIPQRNSWHEDWPSFFRENRIAEQVDIARRQNRWRSGWDGPLQRLLERLDDLLPRTPPAAMCHGDLWSGNVVWTAAGAPGIVDPAAYFGHAESDLAMMRLFGGFEPTAFEAYHHVHPRTPGHEERASAYLLYHLINHLNHFGAGYAAGVERALLRVGG